MQFLVEGGMSSLRAPNLPEHGELPDLADVLKCIAIECEALWQAQVLN